MPTFLSRHDVYRMLERELPENVYPDGEPNAFFSTADMDSIADVAATGYANLERIYVNYWPQTADERLTDWEITAFGRPLEANLSLDERRDRVVQKLRAKKGITKQDMIDAVKGIIGSDKEVDIIPWGCGEGGPWLIGVSLLGFDTRLGASYKLKATGPDLCPMNPAAFGISDQDWAYIQQEAYTYEVMIGSYFISAAERIAIDSALTEGEPARSTHVITDGVVTPDSPLFGFDGDDTALGFGDLNDPNTGGFFGSL